MAKKKIIRISTVPLSLVSFCKELLCEISSDYQVLAVSSAGSEMEELSALGIPTATVEMKRAIAPLSDLVSLIHLIRLFRRERPDMVHSITPKAGLLAMAAAWIARVPVRVHSFTGLLFPTATGLKRRLLMTTDKITCACATDILPEGEGVKHDLASAGITRKPMKVLGYGNVRGIDLLHYSRTPEVMEQARQIRAAFDIAPTDTTLVFVGRIVGDKGINELTSAFTSLAAQRPDLHLIMAGVFEQDDPVSDDTYTTLHSCTNVHLTESWVKDVRPYYAAADVLVFPSYREGFPNVVIEAGAMGLPSIVTDINGSREIITQGVNGIIVPPKDTPALEKAIKNMYEDSESRGRMAANARDIIAQRYEAGFVRECLKKFYKEVLE